MTASAMNNAEKLKLFQKLLDERNQARIAFRRYQFRLDCVLAAEDLNDQYAPKQIPAEILQALPSRAVVYLQSQGYIKTPTPTEL